MSDYIELIRTLTKCGTFLIIAGLAYLGVHRYTETQKEIAMVMPMAALELAKIDKMPCKPAPKKTVIQ